MFKLFCKTAPLVAHLLLSLKTLTGSFSTLHYPNSSNLVPVVYNKNDFLEQCWSLLMGVIYGSFLLRRKRWESLLRQLNKGFGCTLKEGGCGGLHPCVGCWEHPRCVCPRSSHLSNLSNQRIAWHLWQLQLEEGNSCVFLQRLNMLLHTTEQLISKQDFTCSGSNVWKSNICCTITCVCVWDEISKWHQCFHK